jgi:hypothetical protein
VAFVTLPGASEDQALLTYLRQNDSLLVIETDATDNTVDYSSYEVIVLGSKPNSGAPGFVPLKGYNKPMVLLKPFLLKSTVWGWGTAVNTSDLSVYVSVPEHPLFRGLTVTEGELQLFSDCNTNAVTAISAWTATEGVERLASPVSNNEASSIAILPAGTDCNGTILPQRMIMIGVSEYSTAYLTPGGKKLIELGVLSKKVQKQFGIDTTIYYAELNWTALMKVIRKQKVEFTDIPKYPAVSRDLALLIDQSIEFQQIEDIARQTEKKLLKKVELFDVYEGDKLPAGKKSYAVNFILQDAEKTMGDKQIDAIMQKLIANLKKQLNAELR